MYTGAFSLLSAYTSAALNCLPRLSRLCCYKRRASGLHCKTKRYATRVSWSWTRLITT